MSSRLFAVDFLCETLYLVRLEKKPYVALNEVIFALQLEQNEKYATVMSDFERSIVRQHVISDSGLRAYVFLSLPKFFAWINSFKFKRNVTPLYKKSIRYKVECDTVLWEYWVTNVKVR